MELNKFSIYTMKNKQSLVSNENNEIGTLEKIDELVTIKSAREAKEFVKMAWGIQSNVTNIPLKDDWNIDVKDQENVYNVKFIKNKKSIMCVYLK